jgi:hypothetical protein
MVHPRKGAKAMSLGGEENRDPTVDAALEVLKRPRIQTQLPAFRGSGVAAAGPTPYEDYLRTWGNIAPKVTTASAVAPSYSGDSPSDMYAGGDNGFGSLSQAEQAAYYADNPTVGAIGRGVLSYFSNTPLGMMQNYFDPGIQTQSDAIMAGMDPTGWQFAGRESDGIFGTQIGGTLSFPELSVENMGMYGWPSESTPTTPSVPSWGQSQSAAAGVTDDAPYGGYVTDGSGNVVTDSSGRGWAYGAGHANVAAAEAATQAAAEAAYGEQETANVEADAQAEANANGEADAAACCFIMLEARYGDGTMDNVVRKYRDEMMTDKNRRGYYKLAEVLVPLMRKSAVFKFIVQKTFADPLVSYGKWHYKENKHGWVFAPIKSMWMKVFDVLGGDTEFIRENGQVV